MLLLFVPKGLLSFRFRSLPRLSFDFSPLSRIQSYLPKISPVSSPYLSPPTYNMPAFKKHNDVEKGAAARDLETSDSSSSDYVPQSGAPEGGATFHDQRNITPGGHPLDRSQPAFPTCKLSLKVRAKFRKLT